MTKSVLNDLFEDIKLFLERASSSDQIKRSRLCLSPLLQPLRGCCVDCVIHHERDVREE